MATFTLTATTRFPIDTEVGAYPASNRPGLEQRRLGPFGSAADTQTMTAAGLTFEGLAPRERHVAHAEVGGRHVYVAFVADE